MQEKKKKPKKNVLMLQPRGLTPGTKMMKPKLQTRLKTRLKTRVKPRLKTQKPRRTIGVLPM